jgi:hypothetical protein
MDRLVSIGEWETAADEAAGTSVRFAHGYNHRRRLAADNPIFRSVQQFLRDQGGWHGTTVQMQKELRDGRRSTVFGRLLHQAIPFLAHEFSWEQHTVPKQGIVHFFTPKSRGKCRTRGCQGKELARGRCWRCFSYLHRRHPGWKDDTEQLLWTRPCRFRDCTNELDDEFFDDQELPLCTYHKSCIHWMMMVEDCVGAERTRTFPWDEDWLAARFFHEIRTGMKPEDKPLFNRIIGDTPLLKVFLQLFGQYESFLAQSCRRQQDG